ncbi:MAG TPA: diguanylate cyclase [Solirubrobacteraceae bacterium]|nr:diguanylate cyclase [Solirubrobacteraceae bacterium]
MSFRTRLSTFFVVIVVVPMAAMAFLVFGLIDNSQAGKAESRAAGAAGAAVSVYQTAATQAGLQARVVARDLALVPVRQLPGRTSSLARQMGLARVTVRVGSVPVADVGSRAAVAPAVAVVSGAAGRPSRTVAVSQLTAGRYARELASPGIQVVVRSGGRVLAATLPAATTAPLSGAHGSLSIGSRTYRVQTEDFPGFGGSRVQVHVLADLAAGGSIAADRVLAAVFIAGFLILAFFFSLLSSRALQSQLARFLEAARRLAGGDFSSPVPTAGRDEFALLGEEFNNMSRELAHRLAELEQERSRVRASIRRIGEAFASGLDRDALLELALRTAIDATSAERGRISARRAATEPLSEAGHIGRLAGLDAPIYEAERDALNGDGIGRASAENLHLATVALGPVVPGGPTHGLITVGRDEPFTDADLDLLRTLAAQTTLALANVNLHHDVQRQAITDDLTGLATHGHFQQLLSAEMEEVRRYRYPVGLIMLDLDDFKSVNDGYGHRQGDLVLRAVADALRQTSRDVDIAARYGGEELSLILPHTDADGAYEMAERVRMAIERLAIPLVDGAGTIHVTASAGAASSSDGDKNELIAAADGALYVAKREGKNRTVKAQSRTANAVGGE